MKYEEVEKLRQSKSNETVQLFILAEIAEQLRETNETLKLMYQYR